ncbi:MAG: hypothetical protein ND866_14895 [Pyrinomonadaceae bacterium]|nr:hypothetical protein [Pyrinomonadaceae bacterium]
MNFEPQKFFIGLIDFFSILLPGAVLVYLTKDSVLFLLFGQPRARLEGIEAWIVFLFSAYLFGHIAFLLGSLLDKPYDWLRKSTYLGQIDRLAKGKSISNRILQWIACFLFGSNADAAVTQAVRIKSRALTALSAEDAINAFQWCKARLSKEHPEGLAAVQRFEADSKFFRTFAAVLFALPLLFVAEGRDAVAIVCAVLLVPVVWRYADQRFKSTQQARLGVRPEY